MDGPARVHFPLRPEDVPVVQRKLVWVDREGHTEDLAAPPRLYTLGRISPDGKRIALGLEFPNEIWLYDLARETLSPFTHNPGPDFSPAWTPDGQRIAFGSTRDDALTDLFWQEVDGDGAAERLLELPGLQAPFSWSPDGKRLLFWDAPKLGMGLLSMEGEPHARPLLEAPFTQADGEISPDGRWLAYSSNKPGEGTDPFEIFVQAFPELGRKVQISTEGGRWPRWAPDGTELYFVNADKMMATSVEAASGFSAGTPEILFTGSYFGRPAEGRSYDISPDGRFLMITRA